MNWKQPMSHSPTPKPPLFDETWDRARTRSTLVPLVQGPTSIFVYWEVDGQKRDLLSEHFQTSWSNLPYFLRVYDVTGVEFDGVNGFIARECNVHPDADHWYFRDLQPQRQYMVDFCTTTWSGTFFTVLRSHRVETPPCTNFRSSRSASTFAPLGTAPASKQLSPVPAAVKMHEVLPVPYADDFDGYSVRERS